MLIGNAENASAETLEGIAKELYPENLLVEQLESIEQWNAERDQTRWATELEANLLCEELTEFLKSRSLANKLKEYSDFCFVLTGALYKFINGSSGELLIPQLILRWAKDECDEMLESLHQALVEGLLMSEDSFDELICQSLDIVIANNSLKSAEKDENGKVKKSAESKAIDVEAEIEALLPSYEPEFLKERSVCVNRPSLN